jgi:hypothetical protein
LLNYDSNTLADYAESFMKVCGLQSVILKCEARFTEVAGNTVDELRKPHLLDSGDAHP